jgi:WD40-like Beta Propeller Repeat
MSRNLDLSPTILGLVGLCFLGIVGTVAYIVLAVVHTRHQTVTGYQTNQQLKDVPLLGESAMVLRQGTALLFRSTGLGETYGRLGLVPLNDPAADPLMTALRCDRVHFAAGQGVCLTANRGVFTTYEALGFDGHLQLRFKLPLRGVPSRVRVSPDGRMAAITVFVSGHSYAAGGFSTSTVIIDLASGKPIVSDLEKFIVLRNGERFEALDFNYWGVTFSHDSNRFYATLGAGGRTYLVAGDLATAEINILRDHLECPSLSPDNTRIAFKKRVEGVLGPATWHLYVLDLKTYNEWPLAETRNVDDQVEWLDNNHILYAFPDRASAGARSNTWVVPADGGGEPLLFLPKSYSTVVVRPWLSQVTTR